MLFFLMVLRVLRVVCMMILVFCVCCVRVSGGVVVVCVGVRFRMLVVSSGVS